MSDEAEEERWGARYRFVGTWPTQWERDMSSSTGSLVLGVDDENLETS